MKRLLYWLRGGSWSFSSTYCLSANRVNDTPDSRLSYDGFRVVRGG